MVAKRSGRRVWLAAVVALVVVVGIAGVVYAAHSGAFEDQATYGRERAQDCGQASRYPNGQVVDAERARQAVACFQTAYAACKAAKITHVEAGVDTSDTYVFLVEPRSNGQGCGVSMHWEFYFASGNRRTSGDEQCARVTSGEDALVFGGCGGFNDITVP